MSDGFPIGQAIVAMLVGATLFPISFPVTYVLGYAGLLSWSSVPAWGFLGPMFVVGLPLSFGILPERVAEALLPYWLTTTVVGWLALIVAMQFFVSENPDAASNVPVMGSLLLVVLVSLLAVAVIDPSSDRLAEWIEQFDGD